jgi:fido (protein-threonine AMPylation protein)
MLSKKHSPADQNCQFALHSNFCFRTALPSKSNLTFRNTIHKRQQATVESRIQLKTRACATELSYTTQSKGVLTFSHLQSVHRGQQNYIIHNT